MVNSVDPDQTQHSVASDLSLHCFKGLSVPVLRVITVHYRDIKPGNVMMNDDGTPVLMDLGSANKARVEIKSRSEAQALQVNLHKKKKKNAY